MRFNRIRIHTFISSLYGRLKFFFILRMKKGYRIPVALFIRNIFS